MIWLGSVSNFATKVRGVIRAFLEGMRQDGFDVATIALAPSAIRVYDAVGNALADQRYANIQGWTFRRQ